MKIRQARDQFAVQKFGGNYRFFVERECLLRWGAKANWQIDTKSPPLSGHIYHSDYVVMCDVCHEQMVIDVGEPFFCPQCLNVLFNGRARKVIFPSPKILQQIENLLLLRPSPDNRNWLPHETPADLKKENREHGLRED